MKSLQFRDLSLESESQYLDVVELSRTYPHWEIFVDFASREVDDDGQMKYHWITVRVSLTFPHC